MLPANSQRRSGHRETQVVIAIICIISIPFSGAMTLTREAARAHNAHIVLEASEKWLAFGRGCASAAGMLLFIGVWPGIVLWPDNRPTKHR